MKAKKLFLLFLLGYVDAFHAGTVSHSFVSTSEQKVMNHVFKHVMTCSNAQKDEFFIDGRLVAQDRYEQELQTMLKQERDQEYQQQLTSRRNRIQFAEMMQVQIGAKLLNSMIAQVVKLIDSIENPALAKFFVFKDVTIGSYEQLMQLKNFTTQLESVLDEKVEEGDFQGLQSLCTKLEPWPARLEKCFQDTIQNAIKKSDDTMMLKELLQLVGQTSGI